MFANMQTLHRGNLYYDCEPLKMTQTKLYQLFPPENQFFESELTKDREEKLSHEEQVLLRLSFLPNKA